MKKSIFAAAVIAASFAVLGCNGKKTVTINSAADLEGKKIGVQAGTTGEIYVEDVKDANVLSFKSGIDASLALRNGAIDAIVLDELPAKEIVKRNTDLKIVEDKFVSEDYAIAVKKGNTELLNSINETIKKIKSDGNYDALVNFYIMKASDAKLPSAPEAESGEVLKMGTNAAFPPFEYTEGSKVVGFDATLAGFIANDYGKKLQIVDMAFDGLIAALQADAIDFIAAGMTATDERKSNVDFSEPYFTSNQVIIVRK